MKLKLLIFFFAVINTIEAQKFYAHWDNGVSGIEIFQSYKNLYAYKIGFGVEKDFLKILNIGTEVNFFKSGFSFQIFKNYIGYANIPIYLKVNIFKWFGLFFGYSNKIFIFQDINQLSLNERIFTFDLYSNKRFVFDYYLGPEFKIYKKIYLSFYYFNDLTEYYAFNQDSKKMFGGLISLKYQIN